VIYKGDMSKKREERTVMKSGESLSYRYQFLWR